MAFVRGSSWQWLVVGIGSLMFVGPATAGKIDLLGYMSQLNGTRKMVFKDADATSTCPKNPISMSMSFMTEKGFIGDYDGNAISGKWMQKGKGDRDVKIKFDGDSLDMFNQWIDNRVSVCILSIPDGKPLKFKKVSFKGKINKKGTRLKLKGEIEFRSKESGVFWDMRGDRSDTFYLNVKGKLVPPEDAAAFRP